MTPQKQFRNRIYRGCALAIVISIAFIGMLALVKHYELIKPVFLQAINSYNPVFWLETIAVEAFAFSWLIKGEYLFCDKD